DLFAGGVLVGRCATRMPGLHNVRNAVAALGAVAEGYAVPLASAMHALASFEGVRRRQELLFEIGGRRVYGDFAHHPAAGDGTLRALQARPPGATLWAVSEPRSATACRALHQREYERAFASAGRVILAPLGRSDIPAAERLDLDAIARAVNDADGRAEVAS